MSRTTLKTTPIMALSVLALSAAFLACAPAEEEAAEAPEEAPAVREVPAPVGEIVVIRGDSREFLELTPGNPTLMVATDVGDPNAIGSVAGTAAMSNSRTGSTPTTSTSTASRVES